MTLPRRKLIEWCRRYAAVEVAGTVAAFAGAWIAYRTTGSFAAAAITGTVSENVGYYGIAIAREVRACNQQHKHRAFLCRAWLVSRNMLLEFGPAEIIDSFLVRPLLLYALPQIIRNPALGWVAGKLLADVVFYGLAIVGYELRKKLDSPIATPQAAEEIREP